MENLDKLDPRTPPLNTGVWLPGQQQALSADGQYLDFQSTYCHDIIKP